MPAQSGSARGDAAHAVEVAQLEMAFGGRTVVAGASWTAPRGGVTALLGPNGAGKTTTIEVAEGFRRAQAGRVMVLGLDPIRDAGALRSRVGVMLQSGGVWPTMSPKVLLGHLSRLYASPQPVGALIEALELGQVASTPYRRLSGGEAQKLQLAAAIIGRPELVFLDEPTTGLDPHSRLRIWHLVEDLRAAGTTVVMTTHLLDEAEHLADQVVVMAAGRIVAAGTVAELSDAAAAAAHIRFLAPPGLPVHDLEMRLPAACRAVESAPGQYEVTGSADPGVVAAITGWCAAIGVGLHRIETRANLSDTYFRLVGATGHGEGTDASR